jgi:hypothetical protein
MEPKAEDRGRVEEGRSLEVGTCPQLDDQPESIKA